MIAGLYFEVNAICILILAIFLYRMETSTYKKLNQHLLTITLAFCILFFASDAIWALIDGGHINASISVNYVVNIIYFSIAGVATFCWFLYTAHMINSEIIKNKTLLGLLSLPAVILILLTITAPTNGWIFYIDEANKYHRGSLYFIQLIVVYGYIIFAAVLSLISAFKKENIMNRTLFISFGIFPIFPMASFAIQSKLPGYPLTAIGLTIPLILVFIKLWDSQSLADELTLLYNRNWLYMTHETLRMFSQETPTGKPLRQHYMVLLDIDHLQIINSKYGVEEGNRALKLVAFTLLNQQKNHSNVIYMQPVRYGGDEFVIIVEPDSEGTMQRLMSDIKTDLKMLYAEGMIPYEISVSIAYVPYDVTTPYVADIIDKADEELFKVKKLLK